MNTILKKSFWSLNFSIIFLLTVPASLYGMDKPKEIMMNIADEMARKAVDAKLKTQRLHNQQQQEKLRQIAALNNRLTDRHTTEAEKLLIHQQLAAHQREIEAANDALRRSNERWDILQNKIGALGRDTELTDMAKNMLIEQQNAQAKLQAIRKEIEDLVQPGMAAGFILMLKNPIASKVLADFLAVSLLEAANIIKLIDTKINSLSQAEQLIENYVLVALGYMPGKTAREFLEYAQLVQSISKDRLI